MGRTNVVIDERLVRRVMGMYKLPTKRAAIDFALRAVAGSDDRLAILELRGSGWPGDLEELRGDRVSPA